MLECWVGASGRHVVVVMVGAILPYCENGLGVMELVALCAVLSYTVCFLLVFFLSLQMSVFGRETNG